MDSAGLERVYRALDVHSEDAVVQEVACACLSNCMSAPGAAKLSLPAGLSAILVRTHTLMCARGVRVVWIPRLCAHHTRRCPCVSSGRARVCPPVKPGKRPAVSCLQLMLTLCDLLCCPVHHGPPLLQRRHRRQCAEQPCVVVCHPRGPNRLHGGGWLDLSPGCHGLADPLGEAEWAGSGVIAAIVVRTSSSMGTHRTLLTRIPRCSRRFRPSLILRTPPSCTGPHEVQAQQ